MVLDSALAFLTFQVAVKVIRNFTQDSLEMCQIHSTSKFHVGTLRAGSPLWEKDTSGVGVLKFTVPQCVTFSIPRHPKASQGIPRHPKASQGIPRHPKASQGIDPVRLMGRWKQDAEPWPCQGSGCSRRCGMKIFWGSGSEAEHGHGKWQFLVAGMIWIMVNQCKCNVKHLWMVHFP